MGGRHTCRRAGHATRLHFMINQPDMQLIGEVVSAEYVRCEPGAAQTFFKMHRLLLGLSGLPEKDIFAAAQRIFPTEHTAYLRAVDAGEIAPLIFGPHADRFKISFDPELN